VISVTSVDYFWVRFSRKCTSSDTGRPVEPFSRRPFPGGAGDVEMRPVILLGEARQEAGGGDGAAGAAADVGHVGEVALQLLLVVVP
jgi:hypothetical protein